MYYYLIPVLLFLFSGCGKRTPLPVEPGEQVILEPVVSAEQISGSWSMYRWSIDINGTPFSHQYAKGPPYAGFETDFTPLLFFKQHQ